MAAITVRLISLFANENAPTVISGATNVGAFQFTLRYDADRVTFIDAQPGDFLGSTGRTVQCNAHASGRWLLAHGEIDREARSMLGAAMESMNLSARGYHRVLRVARTISDLAGEKTVRQQHVAEALRFRPQ